MQQRISQKTFDSADAGDMDAQILLGASYLYRRNDLPRDITKACNYLEKAYAQGSGLACMFLMQMHEKGIGKTADLKEAYEWALEAKRLKMTWVGQDEDIARLSRGEAPDSKKRAALSPTNGEENPKRKLFDISQHIRSDRFSSVHLSAMQDSRLLC